MIRTAGLNDGHGEGEIVSAGPFPLKWPIYSDDSWVPGELEHGLLRADGTLWVERFTTSREGGTEPRPALGPSETGDSV